MEVITLYDVTIVTHGTINQSLYNDDSQVCSHHQQKRTLRLIRRRCVLMQATHLLRPIRPVRPDSHCNAPPHPTLPDATWQRSLRPDATWRPPYVWTTPDSFSHLFFLLMRR